MRITVAPLFCLVLLPATVDSLSLLRGLRTVLPPALGGLPWYDRGSEAGLDFGCTGCGRCCQMDGDVWLAPEEVTNISDRLNISTSKFEESYSRDRRKETETDNQPWLCLLRGDGIGGVAAMDVAGGCVFLDPVSRQCKIYDVRPVQCSTYPFWPSLLEDREAWDEEAVLADEVQVDGGRHWSLEDGGCEGINHPEKSKRISAEEIRLKRKIALDHWLRFPDNDIKETTWYL